jgi:serine protease inhibitor
MHTSNEANSDVNRLVAANNDFGFRLLSLLVEEDADKTVFISSFSVAIALAMTYNGAEGKTKEAMAETLGLKGLTLQQVNEANAGFMLMQKSLDPKVQLAIANSIWVRDGIVLSPDFIRRIKVYYAGKVAGLDFSDSGAADIINQWVAVKTYEKIRELVTPPIVSLAELILINAIYFKGIWTNRFDKEKTTESDFNLLDGSRKRHPMMLQSGNYDYYENDEFQAVSLPYGERRISLYVFLPKPTFSISDFQKALTIENWQQWMSEFDEMKGAIVLPRFKVEYGEDLLPGLMALGGKVIAGSDFESMGAGPLLISKVIHKTFVEVNEEGTEAAAVTAVVMRKTMTYDRFSMVVDRPFFCAIRDNETGAVLFMGFVLDPN